MKHQNMHWIEINIHRKKEQEEEQIKSARIHREFLASDHPVNRKGRFFIRLSEYLLFALIDLGILTS